MTCWSQHVFIDQDPGKISIFPAAEELVLLKHIVWHLLTAHQFRELGKFLVADFRVVVFDLQFLVDLDELLQSDYPVEVDGCLEKLMQKVQLLPFKSRIPIALLHSLVQQALRIGNPADSLLLI